MKFFTFRVLLSYCAQLSCDFMILHCIGFSNLMLMWCFVVMVSVNLLLGLLF